MKNVMEVLGIIRKLEKSIQIKLKLTRRNSFEKGIKWFKNYAAHDGCIGTRQKSKTVNEKLMECCVSTLHCVGEKEFSYKIAKCQAINQKSDGSFVSHVVPRIISTSQVIDGFLTVHNDLPELKENLINACNFLESQITEEGRIKNLSGDNTENGERTEIPENAYLCVLPPLLKAERELSEERFFEAAMRGRSYFLKKEDLLEFKSSMNLHFFGCLINALIELGDVELAKKGLDYVVSLQRGKGGLLAGPVSRCVCFTGMAQMTIAYYKLGWRELADRAMAYLENKQNPNGSFYCCKDMRIKCAHREQIGLAEKFYLDAYMLRMKTDFANCGILESVEEYDGRVKEITSFLGNLNGKRVLDVGCGKGRYLRLLIKQFPNAQCYGIDVSEELLRFCPKEAKTSVGTMLAIKYPDSWFDCVLSIEALEHAVNIEAAVKEMSRVLKPGGKIIIIDKNEAKLGTMKIMPWERWFSPKQITQLLSKYGVIANHKQVPYEQLSKPDGLFLAWEGTKLGENHSNLANYNQE